MADGKGFPGQWPEGPFKHADSVELVGGPLCGALVPKEDAAAEVGDTIMVRWWEQSVVPYAILRKRTHKRWLAVFMPAYEAGGWT